MKELQNISFNKTLELYKKYFSLNYLGKDMNNKLACIALTCYITNELKQKGKDVSCYDVLLKIGKDFSDSEKNTFLKSLGAICEDLMYGCETFTDFGIKPSEMPKTLKTLLDKYIPF